MTVWLARAAAAIVLGLALSPIATAAQPSTAAGQAAPVSVTMVATFTVPERRTGFIDPEILATYTSEFGLLTRQLNQVIDHPVVLGIDPAIIASIRVLGSSAPASATAWLSRLDAATNQTFPLSWADADLTLPLHAGSPTLLAPESFDFAIDPNLFAAPVDPIEDASPTPTVTPTPVPGEIPLPTTETLVAWDYTVPSIAWPAMNSVTADDLALLGDQYDTIIVSSANVGSSNAETALAQIGATRALVSDEALSELFSATVSASSVAQWEVAMATLATAMGGVTSTTDEPASVLLALDRAIGTSDTDLALTIDSLAASPNVQVLGLEELLASDPRTAEIVDLEHDDSTVTLTKRLLADETADRAFATIAENPALITGERRLDLLATLSNSWIDNQIGWEAARTAYLSNSQILRSSVKIVKSSEITLWADRASLPITVSNELDQPVTVYVTVRPVSPLLKVENSLVPVTVEPSSDRKASVPVQSLSNGIVELAVSLHTPSGAAVGSSTFVRITVQAGWETPFTVGFGILVVLVFAFGIIRTIVRRRKARATEV